MDSPFSLFKLCLKGSVMLLFLTLAIPAESTDIPLDSCFQKVAKGIPKWHIFHKLCKPIIIGHRGNPSHRQENTIEGFKSVQEFGGQGFELDVVLTKDKKLVLFHDSNVKKVTGVDRKIQDMTSEEIKELRYTTSIEYGSKTYTFRRRLKLTFLERVLKWMKNKDLLVLIETKPDLIVLDGNAQKNSKETGIAVAKMVRSLGMEDQVIINGFDYYAVLSAKLEFPRLVVGTFVYAELFSQEPETYGMLKDQFKRLMPGLETCLDELPNDNSTFDFLYKSGTLEKSMDANYNMIDARIFNNIKYGGAPNADSFKMIKKNYGKRFVTGAGIFYPLGFEESVISQFEPVFKALVNAGADILVTDDLRRTKQLVRETLSDSCHAQKKAVKRRTKSRLLKHDWI
ncbi:uncharacterized protein LOC135695713 isoform X1 [Rhopilema esculentum]|uniref:uncharacterized protein LOC135695713 isoform X1 n=1 Tax=Rhopilema esculentum TaxID=499914 RepID=UPI0031D927B2